MIALKKEQIASGGLVMGNVFFLDKSILNLYAKEELLPINERTKHLESFLKASSLAIIELDKLSKQNEIFAAQKEMAKDETLIDSVGLFRSEFLFMNSTDFTSEDAQFEVYKKSAELCKDYPLTIRTLDIGGDKPLPYHTIDQKLKYNKEVKVGIMIETPAPVFVANELAEQCDFSSIGTNDLTQYILAVDRGNTQINHLYNSTDKAVLAAIRWVISVAKRKNIEMEMCGELASDIEATRLLLEMGLNNFSVSIGSIPVLKETIRNA